MTPSFATDCRSPAFLFTLHDIRGERLAIRKCLDIPKAKHFFVSSNQRVTASPSFFRNDPLRFVRRRVVRTWRARQRRTFLLARA